MTLLRGFVVFVSLGSLVCSAATINGSVINGTTGHPVPGQEIALLATSGETDHTSTDEAGGFRFELPSQLKPDWPLVVSAVYRGVQYFHPVTIGEAIRLSVYDASRNVRDISGYMSVLQFQVKGNKLQVTELHAIENASNPPVTRVDPDNLVLSIPEGAQMQPAIVSGPERGTLTLPLLPLTGESTRYRIDFPLKPGMTKYAITYEVPYDSRFVFRREAQYAMKGIGIVMPDSLRFRSLGPESFRSIPDQPGRQDLVLDGLKRNQLLSFELSGSGELARALTPSSPHQSAAIDVQREVQSLVNARWPGIPAASRSAVSPHANASGGPARIGIGVAIVSFAALLWSLIRRRALQV